MQICLTALSIAHLSNYRVGTEMQLCVSQARHAQLSDGKIGAQLPLSDFNKVAYCPVRFCEVVPFTRHTPTVSPVSDWNCTMTFAASTLPFLSGGSSA